MSAESSAFRHAPGCAHADWGRPDAGDAGRTDERDPLLRLSLGRSMAGGHTDIYRCQECAAKGPLDR